MGFTVACARCHDHKYDPIPTKDYYSLYSIFSNIRQPKELPLLAKDAEVSATQSKLSGAARANPTSGYQRISDTPPCRDGGVLQNADRLSMFARPRMLRARAIPKIEELVRDRQLNLARAESLSSRDARRLPMCRWKSSRRSTRKATATTLGRFVFATTRCWRRPPTMARPARAMAVEDVPNPAPVHVFIRGNPNNPGALTPPHFCPASGAATTRLFATERAAGTGAGHHRSGRIH